MGMLVEAPAAVEDALASLLDHTDPLVQVRGGWAAFSALSFAEAAGWGCLALMGDGWRGWGGVALP